MKYYKAQEVAHKPFVIFNLVAKSLEELEAKGLADDPLVRDENNLPYYDFNVCYQKIENGVLVDRSGAEMADYEVEYGDAERAKTQKALRDELKVLYEEMIFTNYIDEDSTQVTADYNAKLTQYNNFKNN